MDLNNYKQGSAGLFVYALAGLLVAGSLFFVTFITSQKAKTPNSMKDLKIPPIKTIRPNIPPLPTNAALINFSLSSSSPEISNSSELNGFSSPQLSPILPPANEATTEGNL
jgi:hypothetical protein